MEEWLKNEIRLIECYRGSSSKDDADENCQKYKDDIIRFTTEGGLLTTNAIKDLWMKFYKTRQYYPPK